MPVPVLSYRFSRWLAALSLTLAVAAGPPTSAQVAGLTGTLVVTNKTPSTATIVDVGSGRTLATLPTGTNPHEVVLSSDGALAVITDYGGPRRTLTVIDVPGLRIARTVDLGEHRAPHGIAFLPGDRLVAVTCEQTRHVVVVDVVEGVVRHAVPTEANGSHMVGVTGDGRRAYTGNMRDHTVSELDLTTHRFVRSFPVPAVPEAINVTPDGREVWVGSNQTGQVSVLDPATGTVTKAAEGLKWPYRMHLTPDGRQVIVPGPDPQRGALHRPCSSSRDWYAGAARSPAGRHDDSRRSTRLPVSERRGACGDHRPFDTHGRRASRGWPHARRCGLHHARRRECAAALKAPG